VTHHVGRRWIEGGHKGSVISIVVTWVRTGAPFVVPSAMSKAGVDVMTKSLAIEWGQKGVRVNAIAPGVFRTDLNQALLDGTERGKELLMRTPMNRFGKVEELAGAAVFLASDAASFVNGEVIVVDGGFLASGVNR